MVPESVRIKFKKTGRLKYISHLDLCRTMCPAMIRAKIPLWYTEGFNPHPKMVFAQPLPLFVESECEYLDIKLTEHIEPDELVKRLRGAFTDELYVIDVYTPKSKFTDIGYAVYKIKNCPDIDEEKLKTFLSGDIFVTKKTKDGEKTLNIKNQIRSVCKNSDKSITAVLDACGESYLNPDLFCVALFGSEENYSVTRTGWLDRDGKEFS